MERTQQTLAELIRHFGIILGTERYDECLRFYRDTIGLPVWFEKDGLCCLRFGSGYLMIETGGTARDIRKPNSDYPTMLRFNIPITREQDQPGNIGGHWYGVSAALDATPTPWVAI